MSVNCKHNLPLGRCLECDLLALQSQFDATLRPLNTKVKDYESVLDEIRSVAIPEQYPDKTNEVTREQLLFFLGQIAGMAGKALKGQTKEWRKLSKDQLLILGACREKIEKLTNALQEISSECHEDHCSVVGHDCRCDQRIANKALEVREVT